MPNFLKYMDGFEVFGLEIRFYAICIIIGIFLAYFYGIRIAKRLGISEDDLFNGFIIGVILGILGARLYYVIFSWEYFKDDPLTIITGFREGGLAIHGAVIAAGTFVVFYVRKKKINIFKAMELVAVGFLIGQIAGRWGNFFNQEANGGQVTREFLEKIHIPEFIIKNMYFTDKVQGITGYFHPTFFYEMIWNFFGLIIIIIIREIWEKYWVGDAAIFYLIWYGIGRFFIEGLRTDPLPVNILGMELLQAQVISLVMVIAGIALLILRRVYKVYPVSFLEAEREARTNMELQKQ